MCNVSKDMHFYKNSDKNLEIQISKFAHLHIYLIQLLIAVKLVQIKSFLKAIALAP